MNGWYKQHRNLSERPWFVDPLMVQLYFYLKERAYVQDRKYEGSIIRRGSCPVTRSEMMEATGMSYKKLDNVLRRLKEYGEIIVRGNNRFSIITICDYDSCNMHESLFGTATGTTDDTTEGTASDTTTGTTHIYKEGRNKKEDNLRSLINPSKMERESNKGLVYEIKKIYNQKFNGILPRWFRLSDKMVIKVAACIERYGRQSVDMVFDQVLQERFSLGQNETGFIADFDFIFRLSEYEKYLSRYELRIKRGNRESSGSMGEKGSSESKEAAKVGVGNIDAHVYPDRKEPTEQEWREHYLRMIPYAEDDRSHSYMALIQAYERGDLQRLGIEWKPRIQQAI